MRVPTLALLAAVPAALAACAPRQPPGEIGPNPQEVGVIAPAGADGVALYTAHGPPGCRYRVAGDLTSGTLLGLRDAAYQKQADAVIDVRRRMQATPPPRRQPSEIQPAAVSFYTGTAVRFTTAACRDAQPAALFPS